MTGGPAPGVLGLPVLRELRLPATLYVATRAAVEQTPVFDVLIRYLLWLGSGNLDLSEVSPHLCGTVDLDDAMRFYRAESILDLLDGEESSEGRMVISRRLAQALGIDFERIVDERLMCLMTLPELTVAAKDGVDVQLHTHNHRLSREGSSQVEGEIAANRAALSGVALNDLRHFCYPSGEYTPRQFAWLKALGIASATTCDQGFNYPATHMLALNRFLDGENISRIEFEAELCGVLEIARRVRSVMTGRRTSSATRTTSTGKPQAGGLAVLVTCSTATV